MTRRALASLSLLALSTFVLKAATPNTEHRQPQQYFTCAVDHVLNIHPNGTLVRCTATVLLSSVAACAPGQIKVQDFIYLTDVCAVVGGNTFSYSCPGGYVARVQSGADMCEKTATSIRPVDVATTVLVTHHE